MLNLDYSSSDDQTEEIRERSPHRPAKRRKLPPLGGSFVDEVLPEESSRHQGRTLARAKVIGDYPTHLFLAYDAAQLSSQAVLQSPLELHVSLSRPLYVRKELRPKLEADIRDAVSKTRAFDISFSALRVLRNDEQTRIFLGVDVAAGYPELTALTERLNAVLRHHHLPAYYEDPIFHTSVAWGLLRPPASSVSAGATMVESTFPSIPDLPAAVLQSLAKHCGPIRKLGGLTVEGVRMKYGAEEIILALGAS